MYVCVSVGVCICVLVCVLVCVHVYVCVCVWGNVNLGDVNLARGGAWSSIGLGPKEFQARSCADVYQPLFSGRRDLSAIKFTKHIHRYAASSVGPDPPVSPLSAVTMWVLLR